MTLTVRAAPSREIDQPRERSEISEPAAIESSRRPRLLRVEPQPVPDLRDARGPAREREPAPKKT